jgi:hypothetical protein
MRPQLSRNPLIALHNLPLSLAEEGNRPVQRGAVPRGGVLELVMGSLAWMADEAGVYNHLQ